MHIIKSHRFNVCASCCCSNFHFQHPQFPQKAWNISPSPSNSLRFQYYCSTFVRNENTCECGFKSTFSYISEYMYIDGGCVRYSCLLVVAWKYACYWCHIQCVLCEHSNMCYLTPSWLPMENILRTFAFYDSISHAHKIDGNVSIICEKKRLENGKEEERIFKTKSEHFKIFFGSSIDFELLSCSDPLKYKNFH